MTNELRNALIDLREAIRARCAFRCWYLPDGALATFDMPMTAKEVAEACNIEDWAELEPCFQKPEACHA